MQTLSASNLCDFRHPEVMHLEESCAIDRVFLQGEACPEDTLTPCGLSQIAPKGQLLW